MIRMYIDENIFGKCSFDKLCGEKMSIVTGKYQQSFDNLVVSKSFVILGLDKEKKQQKWVWCKFQREHSLAQESLQIA